MGFCVVLGMNSVGIPGRCRGSAGFSTKLWVGVVSCDLGSQEAFAQIATCTDVDKCRSHVGGNGRYVTYGQHIVFTCMRFEKKNHVHACWGKTITDLRAYQG